MENKLRLAPPKVMVVCDHQAPGTAWYMDLQQDRLNVVVESLPGDVVQRWEKEIPDLILLDLDLSEGAVLELIRKLRAETLIPILLLTSAGSEEFVLETYKSGVDECILKPINAALLQAKMKAWIRRSWNISVNTLDPLRVGKLHLFPTERTLIVNGVKSVRLTNLELRLIYFLMGRPNHVVSIEELNQRVWGYNGELDNTMLKNVVYRLRHKIEPDLSKPQYIQTVVGVGYKLVID